MTTLRVRLIVASVIAVAGVMTLSIAQAQQPAAPGEDPHFTGISSVLDG